MASGNAPTNDPPRLTTVRGTPWTWKRCDRSMNSFASTTRERTFGELTAIRFAIDAALGQYWHVGVTNTMISTSASRPASFAVASEKAQGPRPTLARWHR